MDYNEIITASAEGKPVDVQAAIDLALTQKVSELVAQERLRIAKSYFDPPQEEQDEEDSEQEEDTEQEADEDSDEAPDAELEDLVKGIEDQTDNGTED